MFAIVRIARIFLLVAFCCGAAFADMHPNPLASVSEPTGPDAPDSQFVAKNRSGDPALLQLASLAPDLVAHEKHAVPNIEPFDFSAMTASLSETTIMLGEMSEKWKELQARIAVDEKTVMKCLSDESTCSQAARSFLSIVDLGRKHEGRARLGWINRAVNTSIRPTSDWAQYGYADFWASPLQALGNGAGDCEDYAIVKYVALRNLGMDVKDLRLVIVQDYKHHTIHAVVAVRDEQRWAILDNRTMAIVNTDELKNYLPLVVLAQQGDRTIAVAAANQVTNR